MTSAGTYIVSCDEESDAEWNETNSNSKH